MEEFFSSLKKDESNRWIIPDGHRFVTESGVSLIPMRKQIMPTIDGPPYSLDQLKEQACSSDGVTIDSWRAQWMFQVKDNAKNFDFSKNSAIKVFRKEFSKPVIVAGSGPSLSQNAHALEKRRDVRIVSCLHNFGYFEDLEIMGDGDYYLNLDAGDITIRELCEGGKQEADFYWKRTKDRTLLTHIMANPDLLRRWQGEILFFTTPSRADVEKDIGGFVDYEKVPILSVGGNALGACMYFANAILGCAETIFIGADFAFDYTHQFHPFKNTYKFAGTMPATDIWGNRIHTWKSYWNFKLWFDFTACGGTGNNPINFVNCTEGGILGAYPDGNIKQIKQMSLADALFQHNRSEEIPALMAKSKKQLCLLF